MRLSRELLEATSGWKKTADGYEWDTSKGMARLFKKGKAWYLSFGGEEVKLPRRASFDHAEGILKELGVS
jgi:hypothetical protein